MGIMSSLFAGVSGLNANGTALSVIVKRPLQI